MIAPKLTRYVLPSGYYLDMIKNDDGSIEYRISTFSNRFLSITKEEFDALMPLSSLLKDEHKPEETF